MKGLKLWLAAALAACVIGCQEGSSTSKGAASPSATAAKAALEGVASSGKMGSGMMPVTSYLEALKKTDPAKASELSKEFQAMGKLSGKPDALKAKAKDLAGKL